MPENQNQDQKTESQTQKTDSQNQNKDEAWRSVDEVKQIISQRDRWKSEVEKLQASQESLASRLAEFEKKEKTTQEQTQLQELEGKRKYQEALELKQKSWTQEALNLKNKVNSRLIPASIKAALTQIEDLAPDAANDIPNLLNGKIGLNEELEPVVIGDDGKPMMDKETLKPISVDAYVKQFVEARPYLRISTQSTTTNLRQGHKTGGGWDIQRAITDSKYASEWIAADKAGYEAASKAYFSPEAMKEMARKKWAGK